MQSIPPALNIDVCHCDETRNEEGRIRVECTRVETGRTTDPVIIRNLIRGWEAEAQAALLRGAVEQLSQAVAKNRRSRSRRPGITDAEREAIKLYAHYKSFSAAARAANVSRAALTKRYKRGIKKALAIDSYHRTQSLPTDARGQIQTGAALTSRAICPQPYPQPILAFSFKTQP